MSQGRPSSSRSRLLFASLFTLCYWLIACDALTAAAPFDSIRRRSLVVERNNNPLNIDWDPAPPPDKGPPLSAGALRDPAYLPAQIGGIVGSYALSLVLVASLLLILSRKRREALSAGDDEITFEQHHGQNQIPTFSYGDLKPPLTSPRSIPRSPVRNFSYPSPGAEQTEFQQSYIFPSPTSTLTAPGIDFSVDQRIVAADRNMAQNQLEDLYKLVMEQEEAKAQGIVLDAPQLPQQQYQQQHPMPLGSNRPSTSEKSSSTTTLTKKERQKPAFLNLSSPASTSGDKEKTQSRTSSILSALRSPRKKGIKGVSISSPIMTPMSGTFPQPEAREMSAIPPRHYAPPPPPPVPAHQVPAYGAVPLTPEYSPHSTQSIEERMGNLGALASQHVPADHHHQQQQQQQDDGGHSRATSHAPTIDDPISPMTDSSQVPLVGLPTSPKPGVNRFPSLPLSPRPENQSFPRMPPTPTAAYPAHPAFPLQQHPSMVPSAVRTGGALPLRAYEPALTSPSATTFQTTKQTVFERMGPLSPMTARTPYTGAAVPYSPYQPYTPCVPMTPSLVTKADRKRMRKLEPKTPTLQMVQGEDEVW